MATSSTLWCLATLATIALSPLSAASQRATPNQRFTVGGRDIVRMDFANTPIGSFPSGLQQIDGIMDVVEVDGRRMLRASSRSAFLIRLPQALPNFFILEFEIIPKQGGNPEDIAIEGTPTINQGSGSANVLWHRDYLQIVGGGPSSYDSKVPASMAASLPGALTQVVLSVDGETMRLFTNGRQMYSQQRKFVRGRVLRVFLGGQDDGPQAVHLASIRVVDAAAPAEPAPPKKRI